MANYLETMKSFANDRHTLLAVFGFIFLIVPGTLFFFLFYKDMFIAMDVLKLIILSVAIFVTPVFLNALVLKDSFEMRMAAGKEKTLFPDALFAGLITSILITSIVFIPIILVSRWLNFSVKGVAIPLAVAELLLLALSVFLVGNEKKSKTLNAS